MKSRPYEVTDDHLRRKAVVYVRQSSPGQVRDNQGSTEKQRAQLEHAIEWGWPRDRVQTIEDDLGVTGAAADHRGGYLALLADIQAGNVGAVFLFEVSRISRNARDQLAFLSYCRIYGVLVVEDGRVHDPGDSTDRFALGIRGLTAELENDSIRKRSRAGVDGLLSKGLAVTRPIIGFVGAKGIWELDPDPRIQSAIRSVFDVMCEVRSINSTVKELQARGIQIPADVPGRMVRWSKATTSSVTRILKNQKYTGDYVYRKQVSDERLGRDGRGQIRTRKALAGERVLLPAHHLGYLSLERWNEIQEIIRLNAPSRSRRPAGSGPALLQGVIHCGKHRHRNMTAGYKKRPGHKTPLHYYRCSGDLRIGGSQCSPVPGRPVDEVIVDAVLARFAPASIAAIRTRWTEALRRSALAGSATEIAAHQARERASDLRLRYMSVDPKNRSVAAELEAMWEEARQEMERLDGELARSRAQHQQPCDDILADLELLCPKFAKIFWANTTTNRDRKEILRRVVSSVVIERRDRESITVNVEWVDDSPPSRLIAKLSPAATPTIMAMNDAGAPYGRIAATLNEMGLRTMQHRPWTAAAVGAAVRSAKQRREPTVAREVSSIQVVSELLHGDPERQTVRSEHGISVNSGDVDR